MNKLAEHTLDTLNQPRSAECNQKPDNMNDGEKIVELETRSCRNFYSFFME